MRGVVIAGGIGKRLFPLTQKTSKVLLPICGRPMIFYPLQTLVRGGVEEVMIVTGGPFAGRVVEYLKDGKEIGLNRLEYTYREGGTLSALLAAEKFAQGEPVAVIYADNIIDEDISGPLKQFRQGATVFLKRVKHPEQHAVVMLNKNKEIVEIEEKPLRPKSNDVIVGIALYDREIFRIAKLCQPSVRGELEIPDANKIYLKEGKLKWFELKGFWCDAGTFEGLTEASEYWEKNQEPVRIKKDYSQVKPFFTS